MTQLDNQTIFNKALFGIRGQDYKQSSSDGFCKYRTHEEDGSTLACAVGHCIPDDVAEDWDVLECDDTCIQNIHYAKQSTFQMFFNDESLPLLSALQRAHDACSMTAEGFEQDMQGIAEDFNLVYTPVGALYEE